MPGDKDLVKKQRYNLILPPDMNTQVQQIAQDHNISVPELIRLFIKLGLIADRVSQKPNAALIIEEDGKQREIQLLPPKESEDEGPLRLW